MASNQRSLRILIASSNPVLTAQCSELIRLAVNCNIYECYTGTQLSQQLELTAGYNILIFLKTPEFHHLFQSQLGQFKIDKIFNLNQASEFQSELVPWLRSEGRNLFKQESAAVHYKLLLNYRSLPVDFYIKSSLDQQSIYLKSNNLINKEDLLKKASAGSEFFFIHVKDLEKLGHCSEKNLAIHLLELSVQSNEIFSIFNDFKAIVKTQFPTLSQQLVDKFDPHFINALKLCCKDSDLKKKIEKKLSASPYYPLHMYLVGFISAHLELAQSHTLLAFCGLLHDLALTTDETEEFSLIEELESGHYDQSFSLSENLLHHGEEVVKLITDREDLPDWVPEVLLKHHERPLGRGFPIGEDASQYQSELAAFILGHMLFDEIYIAKNSGHSPRNILKSFSLVQVKNGPLKEMAQKIQALDIFNS